MELNDLPRKGGEWLLGAGPESDIVISSRVRLARNVDGFAFHTRLSAEQQTRLERHLRRAVLDAKVVGNPIYINLNETAGVDRLFLVERHLISKEHSLGEGDRAVIFDRDETVSIMLLEEDHIRLQVLRSGLQLWDTWEKATQADDRLESFLDYSFSPQYGYLTACPTNLGTGMRASVMFHLPALQMSRQMDKVLHAVEKMRMVVRGLYGEGSQAYGDFFQISNQVTLGLTEEEIVERLSAVVPKILEYERNMREVLMKNDRALFEDRVWRARGILATARSINSEEAMSHLSSVRMGINLGILPEVGLGALNELFILTLPAHIQKLAGRELETAERDQKRAEFIRERLALN
ncbi:MAG: protein arginine kinase [Planctomycetes bacterium]|nr:protein arginine kinase [Planctomycetota bacterium]